MFSFQNDPKILYSRTFDFVEGSTQFSPYIKQKLFCHHALNVTFLNDVNFSDEKSSNFLRPLPLKQRTSGKVLLSTSLLSQTIDISKLTS